MNLVDQVEAKEMKKEVADVHIGDTVKAVSYTHLTLPTIYSV